MRSRTVYPHKIVINYKLNKLILINYEGKRVTFMLDKPDRQHPNHVGEVNMTSDTTNQHYVPQK